MEATEFFGRAVHASRAERGMSRYDLRDKAGVSYPYIAELEAGNKNPSMRIVEKLAGAMDMKASELLARAEYIEKTFG
jgi:transcriptional regulator with XRE-family HTH domain